MADIVNLRQARKRRSRSERERAAETNRLQHGRTGAEKKQSSLERDLSDKRLAAHRREPGMGEDR